MKNRRAIGEEGEIYAMEYLHGKGYSLRHKNYRTRKGELDLVMDAPDGTLVFIEVKCDLSGGAGIPESWITPKKIRQVQKTAFAYCSEFSLEEQDMRFDVVCVDMTKRKKNIRHIENAFLPDTGGYY